MTVPESDRRGRKREREREKKCLYVERHIYGPINSVFKHSHTFSQRDVAYSHGEKHSTSAILHELLNERKIDLRLSVHRECSLFYYRREIERGVQFELYRDESLEGEGVGTQRRFGQISSFKLRE